MNDFIHATTSVFTDKKTARKVLRVIGKGGWVSSSSLHTNLDTDTFTIGVWHMDLIQLVNKVIGETNWKIKRIDEQV